MALPTELDGAAHSVTLGATSYKAQGTITVNLTPRTANARAGGDDTARLKPIGLDDGAGFTCQLISTDEALLTLQGTETTGIILDSATTRFSGTVYLQSITKNADVAGMITFDVAAICAALPTTPSMSHIAV